MKTDSDAERGRQTADRLWKRGLKGTRVDDPLTTDFARAALTQLEFLQENTAGVLREVLEGAQISAEQLNVESFHGLIEVVQNADDLHAREVRVGIRENRGQQTLLIAHDGDRVQLHHVIAMTLAFVSTKRDDPRAKGRFGIGLKTLGRLGESLTVHCPPYHFTIEGNIVRSARRARSISGFYDQRTTHTLLELRLRSGFDVDEFRDWLAKLGAQSLVFLNVFGRSLQKDAINAFRHEVNATANADFRKIVEFVIHQLQILWRNLSPWAFLQL